MYFDDEEDDLLEGEASIDYQLQNNSHICVKQEQADRVDSNNTIEQIYDFSLSYNDKNQ